MYYNSVIINVGEVFSDKVGKYIKVWLGVELVDIMLYDTLVAIFVIIRIFNCIHWCPLVCLKMWFNEVFLLQWFLNFHLALICISLWFIFIESSAFGIFFVLTHELRHFINCSWWPCNPIWLSERVLSVLELLQSKLIEDWND